MGTIQTRKNESKLCRHKPLLLSVTIVETLHHDICYCACAESWSLSSAEILETLLRPWSPPVESWSQQQIIFSYQQLTSTMWVTSSDILQNQHKSRWVIFKSWELKSILTVDMCFVMCRCWNILLRRLMWDRETSWKIF